jgi:hypothetical protein
LLDTGADLTRGRDLMTNRPRGLLPNLPYFYKPKNW